MLTEPSPRRSLPVKLRDVRPDVRGRAALLLASQTPDEDERLSLLAAAVEPSDTTYWLHPSAEAKLKRVSA